jgi:hypothetical protein
MEATSKDVSLDHVDQLHLQFIVSPSAYYKEGKGVVAAEKPRRVTREKITAGENSRKGTDARARARSLSIGGGELTAWIKIGTVTYGTVRFS